MQKRRGPSLPITMVDADDANKGRSSQRRSRHSGRNSGGSSISLLKIFLLVASGITLLLMVSSIRRKRKNSVSDTMGILDHELALQRGKDVLHNIIHKVKNNNEAMLHHGKAILEQGILQHSESLKNFTSLTDIYPHTELIALYFGASWCPSCLAFTSVLDNAF